MYKLMVVPLLVLILLATGCQQKEAEATSSQTEMMATEITDKYLEIFNAGNMALVATVIDTGMVTQEPASSEPMIGRDAFRDWITMYRTAYPDFNLTFGDIIAKDDRIIVHWTVTGTHNGPLRDMPPTGNTIRVRGLTMFKIEDGMITEQWIYYDNLGASMQLGAELVRPEA